MIFAFIFHSLGAFCASVCYTPQKKIVGWSWQTFWMTQALFCWFIFPLLGAYFTIPHLSQVLSEIPFKIMGVTFLMGMAYGVGGTAFGIAIRYIGYSLTYAIAIGLSAILGTLIPPLVHGKFTALMNQHGFPWVIRGILVGIIGIACCGLAGRLKEKIPPADLLKRQSKMWSGLLLAFCAGSLSAVYGLAMDLGAPMAQIARNHGGGDFSANIIYIFANSGACATALIYCSYLHHRAGSWNEFKKLPSEISRGVKSLKINYLMAILTGALWYSQFFFYTLGHAHMMGYEFVSWAIHMILLVLLSNLVGILFREWNAVDLRAQIAIGGGLFFLILAIIFLSYGSYLG